MKIFKKMIVTLSLIIIMLPVTFICTACGETYAGEMRSLCMSTSNLHTTRTTYHVGDGFDYDDTYVELVFYSNEEQKGYNLSYPLTMLNKYIEDIEYEIIGFDTSKVTTRQEVTIKISSPTYENEVETMFEIKVLPEYIKTSEIVDNTAIKSVYVVNEELDYSKLKIKNTYNNGKEEIVDVTSDMVTGFDTSIATAKNMKLEISYNEQVFQFDYVVAPSNEYKLLVTPYIRVFVPSADFGYVANVKELTHTYEKQGVSVLEFDCYSNLNYSESYLKNFYFNTSGSFTQTNVNIRKYITQEINGINATICKFNYNGSSQVFTGIWFERSVLIGNSISNRVVEILYYGNAETEHVINTVMQTMTK